MCGYGGLLVCWWFGGGAGVVVGVVVGSVLVVVVGGGGNVLSPERASTISDGQRPSWTNAGGIAQAAARRPPFAMGSTHHSRR